MDVFFSGIQLYILLSRYLFISYYNVKMQSVLNFLILSHRNVALRGSYFNIFNITSTFD